MTAGGGGSGASHGSSASIFKNPFDVEKDQLIRQVFELPVRIAAFVQSCRNQVGIGSAHETESPFSIFAGKSTAEEEMGASRSLFIKNGDFSETDGFWRSPNSCLERIDCAIEARQDNSEEPITYGREKCKRTEFSPAGPSSTEYSWKSSLPIETSKNQLGELDVESQKSCDNRCTNKPLSMSASDEVFSHTPESKEGEKVVEKYIATSQKQDGTPSISQIAKRPRLLAGRNEVVPEKPASTIKITSHDAAEFIIMVIRTLRHTKDGNMQKLFEVLSVPEFPVEKCRFLEELIQQAHNYNKEGVAKELCKYRSEIMRDTF